MLLFKVTFAKKMDIDRLFTETKKSFGRLDILVNNAGHWRVFASGKRHRRTFSQAI